MVVVLVVALGMILSGSLITIRSIRGMQTASSSSDDALASGKSTTSDDNGWAWGVALVCLGMALLVIYSRFLV
jgi:hypothetical protein